MEKLNENWLYETHSPAELHRWVSSLKFFYFCRAWGGHANDGDTFELYLSFADKENLLATCTKLGISLNVLSLDTPKPVPGKAYSGEEFNQFRDKIREFPEYEQPCHSMIFGCPVFIWIENGKIRIELSGAKDGNFYEVSELDFENCLKIEKHITTLDLSIDDSIQEQIACVSRARYPELYE